MCIVTCIRRGNSPDARESTVTTLVVCNSRRLPSHQRTSTENIYNHLDRHKLWDVAVKFVQGEFARGGSGLIGRELDHRAIEPTVVGADEAAKFTEPEM